MFPRPLLIALLSSVAGPAGAGTFTWTNPAGGSWGTPSNWNSAPTFAADDLLDFSTLNITANAATTLDGNRTVGSLKFGDATTVSNTWTVNAGTGGTLTLSTTTGNPTITTVAAADVVTLNVAIAGTQTIVKAGAGTLNLTGANTFTGLFQVDPAANSIVNVSGNQSAATGGWNIRAGATVNFQAGSTIAVASGKSITLANESTAGHTLNVAGTVTSSGTLSVQAAGNVNLNSGAAWTQNGSMTIQPNTSFASAQMTVNTGASFTYAGSTAITLAASPGSNGGSGSLNLSGGTFTTGRGFNNSSSGTAGAANLNFSNGGTLKLSADIATLATTNTRPFNITVGTGGGKIDTNGFNTTLALPVSGTGSLEKLGAGNLTLTGTNTYTGATTVTAGKLLVNGATNSASAVDVAAAGTLGGNGSVAGAVNVTGALAPGVGIESLATGALTLNSGSTLAYELNSTALGGDLLVVNGALTLNGLASLSLTELAAGTLTIGNKLTLINYSGTWNGGTFSGLADDSTFTLGANQWQINYNDVTGGSNFGGEQTGPGFVTLTVVPEPSCAVLGGLGLLYLLRRRRL
ncbi:autotransporter-associated beta strand repeat-containing protein [Luteolibacter ambystomatis]|uniref:Autotransporter-associated beta strand repeat-containing protein n=1 Tax=Luteolibacter ambystomatis TaxID=2824561 RepID=A0A975IXG4_9BACT|nr:autotransporter-associated beta strand repeat-containing protein [Luteolibacter ambystomatis]QUE49291.1 autotransporter-associated beta strand repeat-containing protein [Luteolibacter ambystomatis]